MAISVVDLADSQQNPEETLVLDEAIQRLEEQDPDMGQLVRLRFYAGLSVEETAKVMSVSPTTVKREWSVARAWLYRKIAEA